MDNRTGDIMEKLVLTNNDIALACDRVGTFLAKASVDRREALRIKLTVEETLLKYQEKFGEEAVFSLRCVKRFLSLKVELVVAGESYSPLDQEDEEDVVIRGLLAGIGLAPQWNYKKGRNYVGFCP